MRGGTDWFGIAFVTLLGVCTGHYIFNADLKSYFEDKQRSEASVENNNIKAEEQKND